MTFPIRVCFVVSYASMLNFGKYFCSEFAMKLLNIFIGIFLDIFSITIRARKILSLLIKFN